MLKNGVFVFDCSYEDVKNCILEQSPWPFDSHTLFLKPWNPNLDIRMLGARAYQPSRTQVALLYY